MVTIADTLLAVAGNHYCLGAKLSSVIVSVKMIFLLFVAGIVEHGKHQQLDTNVLSFDQVLV